QPEEEGALSLARRRAGADGSRETEGDLVPHLDGRRRLHRADPAFGDDEDLVELAVSVVVQGDDRAEIEAELRDAGLGRETRQLPETEPVEVRVPPGPDRPRLPLRPGP